MHVETHIIRAPLLIRAATDSALAGFDRAAWPVVNDSNGSTVRWTLATN